MKNLKNNESGASSIFIITTIVFALLAIGLGIGFGWAYLDRNEVLANLDITIEEAKADQRRISSADCAEEMARPFVTFTGPSDFGSVTFEYPRTWSAYVHDSGLSSGHLRYYFHPSAVPTINDATIYALRLYVESRRYEDILRGFEGRIRNGDLTATPVTAGYHEGMRISGSFSPTIGNGTMVVFRIRDKTLIMRTDSTAYLDYFNDVILASLRYNE